MTDGHKTDSHQQRPAAGYVKYIHSAPLALFHCTAASLTEEIRLHCTLNTNRFLYDLQKMHGHVYYFSHLSVASEGGEDQKFGLKRSVLDCI